MPMMKIGSHRLPELIVIGPMIDALADQHDRERDREQIDRKGPQHVEDAREHHVDDAAEKAGDERRRWPPGTRQMRGRGAGDQQRIAPAIEQPRRHVAALAVGAEEIGADIPGRADRREAEAEALGRGLASPARACRRSMILPLRLERNGIGLGDIGGVERRRQAGERRSPGARRSAPMRGPVGAELAQRRRPGARRAARRGRSRRDSAAIGRRLRLLRDPRTTRLRSIAGTGSTSPRTRAGDPVELALNW